MWLIMIMLLLILSYIDTRGFNKLKDKKTLILYTTLLAISFLIGTASEYLRYMPSPSEPIKNLVLAIVGK